MKDRDAIVKELHSITRIVIDNSDEASIPCTVSCSNPEDPYATGEPYSGVPSNFIDAIDRKKKDDTSERFHSLICEYALSFKNDDGAYPNAVIFHFSKGQMQLEVRTRYYSELDGLIDQPFESNPRKA